MAQDLLFPGNILSLHRAAVDKLARQGDGDAALLYLVLAAGGNSGALPWGPEKVEGAKNTLIQLGLLPSDAAVLPPSPRSWRTTGPPEYTSQDIAQALQDTEGLQGPGPGGGAAAGEGPLPRRPQDPLHPLRLSGPAPGGASSPSPAGAWSRPRPKGPGRKPTLTQIRREAYKWQKAGIDTLEAADAHLPPPQPGATAGRRRLIQLLFGESRAPVAKEAEYLDAVDPEGLSPTTLLLLARDRTIYQLQELQVDLHERHPHPLVQGQGPDHRGGRGGLATAPTAPPTPSPGPRPRPRPRTGPAAGLRDDVDRMFQELQTRRADPRKEG